MVTWRTLISAGLALLAAPTFAHDPTTINSPSPLTGGSLSTTSLLGVPVTKLLASDAQADAWFGFSIALESDTAVIGARIADTAGADSGGAYVFENLPGGWTEQATLIGADTQAGDAFGLSVGLSGNRAIVGAPFDDDSGTGSGAAYIFVRTGSSWTQEAKFGAFDGAALDQFGTTVTINGDTAAVGAPGDDDGGQASGSAYVYRLQAGVWQFEAKLVANDPAADAALGGGIDLLGDELVVGAPGDQDGQTNSGSAYIFTRVGSVWSPAQKLYGLGGSSGAKFGQSLALTANRLAIGAPGEHTAGSGAGAAYLYERSGSSWTNAIQVLAPDGAASDAFGTGLDVDGAVLVVGSPNADAGAPNGGAVYVFSYRSGAWLFDHKIVAQDSEPNDSLGWPCALSDQMLFVGAWLDDDGGSFAGSTYVFKLVQRVTSFCTGDGLDTELATSCPCANLGAAGHGCANSTHLSGGLLAASGDIRPNNVLFTASDLPSGVYCYFVESRVSISSGEQFGDGIGCLDKRWRRFGGQITASGIAASAVPTGSSGTSYYYQAIYRDLSASFCSPSTINTTNAVKVIW